MELNELLTVCIIGLFVVMTPGPNMAIVLKNSLSHSRRAGVCTAAGLVLGNLVHIAYCLVGIGVLISQSILAFNIIRWLGAAYLVYLGIKSLRARPDHRVDRAGGGSRLSNAAALRTGFLTDLLNPKATLFYLALFTQIVRPDTPLYAQIVYGVAIALLEFACFSLLAAVIGHELVVRRFESLGHWIERCTGAVLIALGIRVAIDKATP